MQQGERHRAQRVALERGQHLLDLVGTQDLHLARLDLRWPLEAATFRAIEPCFWRAGERLGEQAVAVGDRPRAHAAPAAAAAQQQAVPLFEVARGQSLNLARAEMRDDVRLG